MDVWNNHYHIKYKTHKDGIITTLQDQTAAESAEWKDAQIQT